MNIKYIVPSYKRPKDVKTLSYLNRIKVYVSPQDYDDYIKYNKGHEDKIVMVPDGAQGQGKGHIMNWILDNSWDEDTDAICIIDDDITCLMAHSKHDKDYEIEEEKFYDLVEHYVILAKDWGCGMFSFGLNSDRLSYDEFAPFRTHAYMDGAFQGFIRNDGLRYDEDLIIKEDVDMFLQQIKKYHKALRIEKYYLKKKSFEGTGGCQEFRSSEEEKREFKMMQKKWGSDIIRPNKPTATKSSSIRGMGGAIKLNLPLEGI